MQGCYNVITVNWNSKGMLRHAASNTRTVGAAVAQLAKYLVEKERRIVRGNLWCIGRSLGAHTCGVAGKVYRFARITGENTQNTVSSDTFIVKVRYCEMMTVRHVSKIMLYILNMRHL